MAGEKPVRIVRSILTGIGLFVLVLGIICIFFSHTLFEMPRIVPGNPVPGSSPVNATWSCRFQNESMSIAVPVNSTVYAAAKNTFRGTILLGNADTINEKFYTAMIADPSQEELYSDLGARFRKIRAERNLTDDEYLELMTTWVQMIPYKAGVNAPPKYPVELVAEMMGDCDDKALLLAGLLSREGYPVALFKFGPESHMALGVGSDAFLYKSTGYTYIEAMVPSFIGSPSFHIVEKKPLESDPLVIVISNGTRLYHSGNETLSIITRSERAERRIAELSLARNQTPESGRDSPEYRETCRQLERYTGIRQYIQNHPYDRPGVYAYLQREMPDIPGEPGR
jgi:hypothetical protein